MKLIVILYLTSRTVCIISSIYLSQTNDLSHACKLFWILSNDQLTFPGMWKRHGTRMILKKNWLLALSMFYWPWSVSVLFTHPFWYSWPYIRIKTLRSEFYKALYTYRQISICKITCGKIFNLLVRRCDCKRKWITFTVIYRWSSILIMLYRNSPKLNCTCTFCS